MPTITVTKDSGFSAAALAAALEHYMAEHPRAAVMEEGRVAFEMARAHYSLSAEHGRCVLQLWSDERNLVRTVVGLAVRKETLQVQVRRFGRSEPEMLQLVPDKDTRTPTTRSTVRARFLRMLELVMAREWGEWKLGKLRSAMDLEHSFGPAYARGVMTRGQSAWAVIAVNGEEMASTVDGVLTAGILWLHACREQGGRRVVEGLRVIVPEGMGEATASRMGWLHAGLAKWELWAMEPEGDALVRLEIGRQGNLRTRLAKAFDAPAAVERFAESVRRVMAMVPEDGRPLVEVRAKSNTEVTFSLHGLEFARARHGLAPGTFLRQDAVTFGAAGHETALTEESEPLLRDLLERLFRSRRPEVETRDALFRLQPERWLEAVLRQELEAIEASLDGRYVYSQVPAFAAGDRGMLDLLTANRSGRLAVLELKADEDLQLPLQGLDYWVRVYQLHGQRSGTHGESEIERNGYFPGVALSAEAPLLYFVAPALRVHPANEIVLGYFAEEIEWELIALNERWRAERQVVFRKRRKRVVGLEVRGRRGER